MNKNHMKQLRKTNKKELTQYTLLKGIIKNLERKYLSFAFNVWADSSPKEESEGIFIDDYISKNNKNNIKNYENEQEESIKGNYNYISNDRELDNEFRKQRKQYVIQYGKNSIKRIISTENENKLKGSIVSLKHNRIENIYKKKEIINRHINRNNIPIPYRIKLNGNQKNNITDPDVKKEYGKQKAKTPLLKINDEEEIQKEIFEFENDFDKEEKERNKPKNSNYKKFEIKFKAINTQNEQKFGLNNIKNKNYSEIGKKSGINKFMKLFSSDNVKNPCDYEINDEIDLSSLKNVINKMENKLINFTKKYFDKWHKESIKYENENNEDKDANMVNCINNINKNQNKNMYISDKPKKSNNTKKQNKPIKSNVTPFGEQNRTYEDVNYPYLQKNEVNPYIIKRNKRQKKLTLEEKNNLFDLKEITTPFGTDPNIIINQPLQKSQDMKLKSKKKKKYTKKQETNLITITPMEPPTNGLKGYKNNSRSNDNLTKVNDFAPFKFKNYNNKTVDNSFVNKYFKIRAINYAKEDINPDVIDIQIKQEKDTESEKIENMTKTIKMGLHLLRKVIRSFQKRKAKGNPRDILKIYFNKWRRINIKMPPILNTEIYTFDKEKEEIYNTNLRTEPIYNNSYKKAYKNINLVKKIKNFNKIYFIENTNKQIESKMEKKDSKNFYDTYNNNDKNIISKNLDVPNSARGSSDSKRNLINNKTNKNRNKFDKNKNDNDNDNDNILSHSYDLITQKENKIPKSHKKSKAKNKIYKIIKKLNKKNEENLLYKYLILWYDMTFNSFDFIPYKNKYKSEQNKSKINFVRNSHDKIKNMNNSINNEEEENRLSIRNIEATIENKYSKKRSVEKRSDTKKYLKAYKENKRKKETDKYNSELTELKNEIKKSILINNNLLNLINLNGNGNRGLSSINNYLTFIKYQNKLLSAYQIYSLYDFNNNNHNIKLKRDYFYRWLKYNKIFKSSIIQENHIKLKNNHCISCNCNKFNLNCIDCNCTKIKNALKRILIRHVYMKKINLRKYYLYLWYKKTFKTIRQIF